ncbi:patatin-like phospholipase family protein [Bacillus cihuensis]|uniref:patatin-like phospholipase family protein n=1 Tax=Bacillus cihuensis TaxID=1208599 RepID=UPI0004146068|nr:patatin-like phospholipase family protein [Bacillus cihuensis]
MIIDGVFSGGGIKGFALVGAVQVMEEHGFIFKQCAGTSAGSIIAALLTAGYSGADMEEILNETNIKELLDSRRILPIPFVKWLMLYRKMGLFKGDALEKWIATKLAKRGIVTFGDIPYQSLRIIVSDITNGQLAVFPDDLDKYGMNPLEFPVAKAVRMSCSIPYFFEPVKLKWRQSSSLFVDGGILSNFPMWLFETEGGKKIRPVIGMNLRGDGLGNKENEIDDAVDMFAALFKTMRDAHDSRYISKRVAKNILFIPMTGMSATDFHLTEANKEMLVGRGRMYAETFLKNWTY